MIITKESKHNLNKARSSEEEVLITDLEHKDLKEFHKLFTKLVVTDFADFPENLKDYYLKNEYSKKNFRIWIDKKIKKLLVAKDRDGKILGVFVGNVPFGGIGIVSWLGVKASARGKRVGQKLLKAYEDYCIDHGCHKIELWTKNVSYYTRFGYSYLIEKITYFGLRRTYMEKDLGEWQGIYDHPVPKLSVFKKVQVKLRSIANV